MTMSIEHLAEVMMRGAEGVATQFTNPDDDWAPMSMGVKPNDEVLVTQLPLDKFSKRDMFEILLPHAIKMFDFQAIGLVMSAWSAVLPSDATEADIAAIERTGLMNLPPDQRKEVLALTALDADDRIGYTAPIARFTDDPPILGSWERSDSFTSWIADSLTSALQRA